MFVPLIIVAAVLAWRLMNNLTCAKNDPRQFSAALRNRHTWIISVIYIGTFGSFIGFAASFPTLLKAQFPEATLSLAFTGALVGSVARPFGGMVADRLGGARVTIGAFVVMIVGTLGAVAALRSHSFAMFMASFLVLFTATGIGNGSVYRMIPAVFRLGVDPRCATSPIGRRLGVSASRERSVPSAGSWSLAALPGATARPEGSRRLSSLSSVATRC